MSSWHRQVQVVSRVEKEREQRMIWWGAIAMSCVLGWQTYPGFFVIAILLWGYYELCQTPVLCGVETIRGHPCKNRIRLRGYYAARMMWGHRGTLVDTCYQLLSASEAQDWQGAVRLMEQAFKRAAAADDDERDAAVAAAPEQIDHAYWLHGLIQVLDDEPLLVLDRPGSRGYEVTISGIGDNFQLHTLLAAALIGDPAASAHGSGTKPVPPASRSPAAGALSFSTRRPAPAAGTPGASAPSWSPP